MYRVHIFYIKNKVTKNGWYIRKIINIKYFIIRSIFKLHFLRVKLKIQHYKREHIIKKIKKKLLRQPVAVVNIFYR